MKKYKAFVFRETSHAVLVGRPGSASRVWLPLSQVKRKPLKEGWELITVEDELAEALGLGSICEGSNDASHRR